MHDGRFATLEQVVEFYNSGASRVYPADPFISKHPNGLNMTSQQKTDLVAFLKAMTDSSFLQISAYAKP
jgi:cytochrome c peroxidase